MSANTFSTQKYYQDFKLNIKELELSISNLSVKSTKDTILKLKLKISDLQVEIRDKISSGQLPSYDQRIYSEQVNRLYELLEQKRTERGSKFSFKTRHKAQIQPSANVVADANTIPKDNASSKKENNHQFIMENRESTIITPKDLPIVSAPIFLTNISNTIIYLPNSSLNFSPDSPSNLSIATNLTLTNISNSIILVQDISGTLFATNLKNCLIVSSSHQVRLHQCENCILILGIRAKRGILEDSSRLKCCQYINFWKKNNIVDYNVEENKWDTWDDFNWLNNDIESPNWESIESDVTFKGILKTNLIEIESMILNNEESKNIFRKLSEILLLI